MTKVKVAKTKKLDQRKLLRISRKYGLQAIQIRELQRGEIVELDERQAGLLKQAGFVRYPTEKEIGSAVKSQAPIIPEDSLEVTTTDGAEVVLTELGDTDKSADESVDEDGDEYGDDDWVQPDNEDDDDAEQDGE